MPLAAPPFSPPAPPIYQAGTLTYTKEALYRLFFWLLVGDLVFTLVGQLELRMFPVFLKQEGASDKAIAIMASSIPAVMRFFFNPIVNYQSDRKRSPRGRRIPYILWAAPGVALFLALIPFTSEISSSLLRIHWLSLWLAKVPLAPAILIFGLLAMLYQAFQLVVSPTYFCLLRDVVPTSHLGRFMSLFRMVGAFATFGFNYWLFGLAGHHAGYVFAGIGAANFLGFFAMCLFVREQAYPSTEEKPRLGENPARWPVARACFNFAAESFSPPLYWWIYVTRLLIYAAIPVASFLIFFAQREIGISLDVTGKILAWPSFCWIVLAYPIGLMIDRRGPIPVLAVSLAILSASCLGSFFFITGETSFFICTLITGTAVWVVSLAQVLLSQQLFHPARMGQLSSANILLQSAVIALVTSPATGWFLDLMRGTTFHLTLPLIGPLSIGPYRFIYLILAMLFSFSLLGTLRVRHYWQKQGGPGNYAPPALKPD
ncbi:MAG TPA: MFS transporter [Opitutaceae bacterium]|jgi:MFS family permease|nr:MFS transporter [Opitutaceae bacterium]